MEELLKELVEKNRKFAVDGNVANYIPELDKADKNALGIYVTTLDGQEFFAGDYNTKIYYTKYIKNNFFDARNIR